MLRDMHYPSACPCQNPYFLCSFYYFSHLQSEKHLAHLLLYFNFRSNLCPRWLDGGLIKYITTILVQEKKEVVELGLAFVSTTRLYVTTSFHSEATEER